MNEPNYESEHECNNSTYSGVWIYLYKDKWYMDVDGTAVFVVHYCPFCGTLLKK